MLFGSKKKQSPKAKAGAADTLICKQTKISGDINFTGVLYIDGHVKGNIISEEVDNSLLTIGKNGFVEGEIQVPHIVILGRVNGDVHALEHVELMSEARIEGNVYYKLIEMAMGAEVNGQMLHKIEKQKLISHQKETHQKKTNEKKPENVENSHSKNQEDDLNE
ncbi:MAG: cytoskeletal protein CcmA (bactofilin family) [Polaribacter sp.]|jgi:cytoskeletal protein CcmA (bactofilin family)